MIKPLSTTDAAVALAPTPTASDRPPLRHLAPLWIHLPKNRALDF
jgi:hypothetical protein